MTQLALARTSKPTILDEGKFIVGATASSQSIDGDGDIIYPHGWLLGRVARGQCKLLDSHNSGGITNILGNVESAATMEKTLDVTLRYAVAESPLAAFAWQMTKGGFLSGYSVGFVPRAAVVSEDMRDDETGKVILRADRKRFIAVCEAMGLDPEVTMQNCSRIILQAELIELSALAVPSNPDAMVKALAAGCVREEDFARIGLGGDDEMHLITKGAQNWHRMDATQRKNLSDMLTGISAHHLQTKGHGTAPADKAHRTRVEAEEKQRDEFLSTCKRLAANLAAAAKGDTRD